MWIKMKKIRTMVTGTMIAGAVLQGAPSNAQSEAIRPFTVHIPDAQVADLKAV